MIWWGDDKERNAVATDSLQTGQATHRLILSQFSNFELGGRHSIGKYSRTHLNIKVKTMGIDSFCAVLTLLSRTNKLSASAGDTLASILWGLYITQMCYAMHTSEACSRIACRALSQNEDNLSRYGGSHDKVTAVLRPSCLMQPAVSDQCRVSEIDWSHYSEEATFSWRHKAPVTSQLTDLIKWQYSSIRCNRDLCACRTTRQRIHDVVVWHLFSCVWCIHMIGDLVGGMHMFCTANIHSSCVSLPYLNEDCKTICGTQLSWCFPFKISFYWWTGQKIHNTLIVVARHFSATHKTIPDSVEPLESFYSPFVTGIDLPHQGVMNFYYLYNRDLYPAKTASYSEAAPATWTTPPTSRVDSGSDVVGQKKNLYQCVSIQSAAARGQTCLVEG